MRFSLLVITLLAGTCGLALAQNQAATNNQSLLKADQTCQRIVIDGRQVRQSDTNQDHWAPWAFTLESSYGSIDDDSLGKGAEAFDVTLSGSTVYRERLHIDIQAGHEYWRWDQDAFRYRGNFVLLSGLYEPVDDFYFGPFVEVAQGRLDVENGGIDTVDYDTFLAAGLLAIQQWQVGNLQLGLTGTLASMNKQNPSELLRKEDTALAALFDATYPLGERTDITGYVYYYSLLDNPRTTDAHYWLFGTELSRQLTQRMSVGIGYTTTAGNADYTDHRLLARVHYAF